MTTATTTLNSVWTACCDIVGTEGAPLDAQANLFDIGLDSLGLAELVIQLEESYGEGCINVDDILANPIISQIAAKLSGGSTPAKPLVVCCVRRVCAGQGAALLLP